MIGWTQARPPVRAAAMACGGGTLAQATSHKPEAIICEGPPLR